MSKAYVGPRRPSCPRHGMELPQSLQAPDGRARPRVSLSLVVFATMAVAAPAWAQTGKPVGAAMGSTCSGVMERLDEARRSAPIQYVKALMGADDSCLGVTERADKARMITRDEYVKAFKRQPDCSAPAYSYMCE